MASAAMKTPIRLPQVKMLLPKKGAMTRLPAISTAMSEAPHRKTTLNNIHASVVAPAFLSAPFFPPLAMGLYCSLPVQFLKDFV